MQINNDSRSRRYLHYENVYAALEGIYFYTYLKRFVEFLKNISKGKIQILNKYNMEHQIYMDI